MRKTHYKVTLDVFVHSDETVNAQSRLSEVSFVIDPDSYRIIRPIHDEGMALRENRGGMDILDITVENVEATDSR